MPEPLLNLAVATRDLSVTVTALAECVKTLQQQHNALAMRVAKLEGPVCPMEPSDQTWRGPESPC